MISVVIPTLNEERYLPELLRDLKGNKLIKEIIVVDGNSEDDTVKIAKQAKARVFSTRTRNGAYQRNLGAKNAKGDWLLFIDADMRVPKGAIRKLKEKRGIAILPFFTIKNRTLRYLLFVEPSNWISVLLPGTFARGGCMLIEKQAFKAAGGFDPKRGIAEDADLGQRLRKVGKVTIARTYVYESDRRYRQVGYLRVVFEWWLNSFWCFLFGKSFKTHWAPVR